MSTRVERDSMGDVAVDNARLWGAQTQRSIQNFKISTERMPAELIAALAHVKRASAQVNCDLGLLDADKAGAIAFAVQEVLSGRLADEFPLSV